MMGFYFQILSKALSIDFGIWDPLLFFWLQTWENVFNLPRKHHSAVMKNLIFNVFFWGSFAIMPLPCFYSVCSLISQNNIFRSAHADYLVLLLSYKNQTTSEIGILMQNMILPSKGSTSSSAESEFSLFLVQVPTHPAAP